MSATWLLLRAYVVVRSVLRGRNPCSVTGPVLCKPRQGAPEPSSQLRQVSSGRGSGSESVSGRGLGWGRRGGEVTRDKAAWTVVQRPERQPSVLGRLQRRGEWPECEDSQRVVDGGWATSNRPCMSN